MLRALTMRTFIRRLWVFVRPHRRRLAAGLAGGVLAGAASAALLVCLRWVINLAFAQPGDASRLPGWLPQEPGTTGGALTLAVFSIPMVMLLRGVCSYFNVYLTTGAATRAIVDLRLRLFEHLQDQPLSFFDRARSGALVSRITSDTSVLHTTVGSSLNSLLKAPATLLALAALLLHQQPRLALVVFVVLPVCVAPVLFYGRRLRQSAQQLQTTAAEWASLMQEAFTANRIVKAYGLEPVVLARCREKGSQCVTHILRVARCGEMPQQALELLGAAGVALALWLAVRQEQALRVGDLFQFVAGVYLMISPIRALSRLHSQFEQARAASQRVFELLETPGAPPDPVPPVPLQAAGAEIVFSEVTFAYGDTPVLQDFNLTVKPGQFVALVGASGAGKSTVVNLLLRFYAPQAGTVSIGGVDIRAVATRELRQQIALVAQETLLFNDTVRQNIAFGRPGATEAEVEAAARQAQAHEFIQALPQGYDTIIGERGVAISGGQRQRLAVARALLKNAPLLVLDEATNALDAESERSVQDAIQRLMAGRTTLCIAHRLSTVQRADLIVVLSEGRVAEAGTHAELIRRGGLYRTFASEGSRSGEDKRAVPGVATGNLRAAPSGTPDELAPVAKG
jgi:subfamily B ATP-binding cassette protein MsbA